MSWIHLGSLNGLGNFNWQLDRRLDPYARDRNPGRLASILIDEIRRQCGSRRLVRVRKQMLDKVGPLLKSSVIFWRETVLALRSNHTRRFMQSVEDRQQSDGD
jgi:hypothetical protein